MTEHDDHASLPEYLWDPRAPEDPEVASLEQAFRPLRFDPVLHPRKTAPMRRTGTQRILRSGAIALAASVLLFAGLAGFLTWRLAWPQGRPWAVTWASASVSSGSARFEVDQPLRGGDASDAHVKIARIGSMDVRAGSDLTLSDTRSRHHRLFMTRGTIDLRVWAPPGVVAVQTPAGDVIDLGCVFQLVVDSTGSHVHVQTGWVELSNLYGETLLPAGTSGSMAADHSPQVPLYDNATPAFREGIRAIERTDGDVARLAIATRILPEARRRDVITLLILSREVDGVVGRPLLDRAVQLVPPPAGVTIDAILNGDDRLLWSWYGTLDLPRPKNWWRNWRDALPWPFSRR